MILQQLLFYFSFNNTFCLSYLICEGTRCKRAPNAIKLRAKQKIWTAENRKDIRREPQRNFVIIDFAALCASLAYFALKTFINKIP